MTIAEKIKLAAELDEAIKDREWCVERISHLSNQIDALLDQKGKARRMIDMLMEQLGWVGGTRPIR